MGIRFLKIASLYLVAGVLLGMIMGMSESFQYTSTHAHVNLLGWVSMGIFGLVYHLFPKTAGTALAKAHFWFHNIGLPVMVLGLVFFAMGKAGPGIPFMGAGGLLVIVAAVLFSLNLFKNLSVK